MPDETTIDELDPTDGEGDVALVAIEDGGYLLYDRDNPTATVHAEAVVSLEKMQ